MTAPRTRWLLALIAAITLVVTGCQAELAPTPSPRPTTAATCPELAARIVDAVQDYVDSFAEVSAGDVGGAVSARQSDFEDAASLLRARGRELGCDPDELADLIRDELGRLTGGTPVQDAVVDTFRADPLGSVDPSDPGPAEVQVSSAQQLVTAVAGAGSGSTIKLAPGTYALNAPLVLLRPITLVGAGDGRNPDQVSSIVSAAAGASVIAATSGNFGLSDLTIEHSGERAASVLVVAGGGYRFERIRVSGAVAAGGAGGYGIVLSPQSNPLTPTGDARVLTDVTLDGNAEGGVVIAGAEKPELSRVHVDGVAGCALCWVDQAGGSASDVTITGGQIGARVDDAASPKLTRVRVDDAVVGVAMSGSGSVRIEDSVVSAATIGIQTTGSGTAALVANQVVNAQEIGIRLAGTTHATLERNVVTGQTPVAIATLGHADATTNGGEVSTTGNAGLIWGEDATGRASNVVIRGPELGVQLAASAAVDLTDVVADQSALAALLASGNTSGTITRLVCAEGVEAAVVFTDASTVRLVDSPTCQEHRQ